MKRPRRSNTLIKPFLLHLSASIGLFFILLLIYFHLLLPWITNHGETIVVPDLQEMHLDEVDYLLQAKGLRYEIYDSVYSEKHSSHTVLKQFPKAGFRVKEGRRVYLTLNRLTPPSVSLPDLIDYSRANAEAMLKNNELKTGRIIFKSSPFFNLVTAMRYQGKPIEAGTFIPKGSSVDLLIGDGRGNSFFTIKSLIGLSYMEVLDRLEEWNLHIGDVAIPIGVDTAKVASVVAIQYPYTGSQVHIGDPIDIWLAPLDYDALPEYDNPPPLYTNDNE